MTSLCKTMTHDEIKALWKYYQDKGFTVSQLSADIGESENRIKHLWKYARKNRLIGLCEPGAKPLVSKDRFKKWDEWLQAGATYADIAEREGLTYEQVRGRVSRARCEGIIQRKNANRTIQILIQGLPGEVRDWIEEITPDGANVVDTLRAIVVDAFHEEMEGKD